MHKEFKVHMLSMTGRSKANHIAKLFDELLTELEKVCPPNRPMDVTREKLEEACFFAKKSMASEPENCEPEK